MNNQNFNYSTDTQVLEREDVKFASATKYSLIIYNDDVNTFQHVTETLIDVCQHDSLQAEQCTLLIHYKGKCAVKHGLFKELSLMCEEILRRGISAKIEK